MTTTPRPRYSYFVAYSHPAGFGNCEYFSDRPIVTFEQITQMGIDIARAGQCPGVSALVVNFQLLSGPTSETTR
jgi:hypothetical protein